jgi:DNA-binding LacI/PurR family transcriptional regulator
MHLPTAQLGRTVAAHLLAELKGVRQQKWTELPIELVVRKSTAAPVDAI